MTLQTSNYTQKAIIQRHWSRQSQPIAPAEILVNRLQHGWELGKTVTCEQHHYGPGRSVDIYTFTLTQKDEMLQLPVQSNPVVRRLIRDHALEIIND